MRGRPFGLGRPSTIKACSSFGFGILEGFLCQFLQLIQLVVLGFSVGVELVGKPVVQVQQPRYHHAEGVAVTACERSEPIQPPVPAFACPLVHHEH